MVGKNVHKRIPRKYCVIKRHHGVEEVRQKLFGHFGETGTYRLIDAIASEESGHHGNHTD
jgi:hypothetical protein